MTSILRTADAGPLRGSKRPSTSVNGGKALSLRRVLRFLSAWDQKQKDREIVGLLARSGGRLTDSLERRIMQREMASDWCIHG